MALNTLETAYVNGQIIDASHINELTLSLLGQFVGRDANGVPTPNQSLGTLAIPWGNLYATGIILNGLALDTSQITSLPNRIVSGQTRNLSSMPDFLRANGAALEFDILGATTDLVLSINNAAVSISSNLNKTGVVAAPSANNTADINDTDIVNDLYAGEIDSAIPEIIIDAVGSEITSRVGQIVAFRTPTGEILKGFLKTATKITNVFRGFYFDSSGNPIARGNLSNNDTITLMNIGWVFVEDNGTTVDITYRTPSISYNAPSSPSTGDYWFDISNQVWKRYSGTSWDIINRILVGEVVSDDTNTIASRSGDFSNNFQEFNNIKTVIDTSEIIISDEKSSKCNVYGTEVQIGLTNLSWNITTDLENPLIEAADTDYYLYLSEEGQEIISDQRPHERLDLKGHYHPYHSWRCVGTCFNNGSSDLTMVAYVPYNSEESEQTVFIKDVKPIGTQGGTFNTGAYQTRDLNTKEGQEDMTELVANQFKMLDGFYNVNAMAPAKDVGGHKLAVYNFSDSSFTKIIGARVQSSTTGGSEVMALVEGKLIIDKTKTFELQHSCGISRATDGFGAAFNFLTDETYAQIKISKVRRK